MTTPPSFPVLPGQGWSVHKKPTLATRVASHVSGREVRAPFYSNTLYEFELTFDGLASNAAYPGLATNSLQSLMGLFIQVQGQFGTFLYTDPTDNSVTNQAIATGDGATKVFTLVRTLGSVTETVSWANSPLTSVFVNGVLKTLGTDYTFTQPNALTFTVAPPNLQSITATFTYAFNCRFLDDSQDFEQFMNGLWSVQSLKFRSIKP